MAAAASATGVGPQLQLLSKLVDLVIYLWSETRASKSLRIPGSVRLRALGYVACELSYCPRCRATSVQGAYGYTPLHEACADTP